MKLSLVGIATLVMCLATILILAPAPTVSAQGPARVTDANSLAQFLKSLGYDPKVITPNAIPGVPNPLPYCLFTHQQMTVKGYAYPTEPLVELLVELNVPPKAGTAELLNVLEITNRGIHPTRVYYNRGSNKIVVHDLIFGNELAQFKKLVGTVHGVAQRVYIALNPPPIN